MGFYWKKRTGRALYIILNQLFNFLENLLFHASTTTGQRSSKIPLLSLMFVATDNMEEIHVYN